MKHEHVSLLFPAELLSVRVATNFFPSPEASVDYSCAPATAPDHNTLNNSLGSLNTDKKGEKVFLPLLRSLFHENTFSSVSLGFDVRAVV